MDTRNQTGISEFLLLALTEDPGLQPFFFSLFLSIYLVTVLGNLLIVLAVIWDSHLHSPMYFFLANLSFTDVCLSTTTIPKMLVSLQARNQSIAYTDCLFQVCFVLIFVALESFLLGVMAYDRYVAICHPLRYTIIMNPRLCGQLILLSLFISVVDAMLHSLMVLRLSFCTDLEIPYFFCELVQVVKVACSDTLINNILLYLAATVLGGISISGIIFSYTQIISSVLRLSSVGVMHKAFSTCASHLSVVSLFYGTGLGSYISAAFIHSTRKTAVASVMYTMITPLMNPFIYSLRNRDVKDALRKMIRYIYLLFSNSITCLSLGF
ncbi:PREDICTED: olfactory receptor 7G2-like [Elephantulus edwardii]|uniref:olfactory receptor 7G2-like n=1 Tax=Elephantulus edwardii TaxID=28737 RepID=UPI0003F0C0C6|nr:PREDICTED: olfactory receptor 7G2-like [Elephantulus edwardii]